MSDEDHTCDDCGQHPCACAPEPTEADRAKATREAQWILKDEANELAMLMHQEVWKAIPHRARIAIRKEIERLRETADLLAIPK